MNTDPTQETHETETETDELENETAESVPAGNSDQIEDHETSKFVHDTARLARISPRMMRYLS